MGYTLDNLNRQSDEGIPGGTFSGPDPYSDPGVGTGKRTRARRRNGDSSGKAAPEQTQEPTGAEEGQAQEVDGDTFQVGTQRSPRQKSSGGGFFGKGKGKGKSGGKRMPKAAVEKSSKDHANKLIFVANLVVAKTPGLGADVMLTEDDYEYEMIQPNLAKLIATIPGYDKIADKEGPFMLALGLGAWTVRGYLVYLTNTGAQPFWKTLLRPRNVSKPHVENRAGTAQYTPEPPPSPQPGVAWGPLHEEIYIAPDFIPAYNGPDPETLVGASGAGAPGDMGFGSPISG